MISMSREDRIAFLDAFLAQTVPVSKTQPFLTREHSEKLAYCLSEGWISARLSAKKIDASFEEMDVLFAYYAIDYRIGL